MCCYDTAFYVKSTFAERLAFARLVHHYRSGESPGNAEIGRAVERTGPWVTKWAKSSEPPTDFRVHAPLAAFLGVEERWLIRDQGDPPMVELWRRWLADRRGDDRPTYLRVAESLNLGVAGVPPRDNKTPAKNVAGVKKNRR